MRRLSSRVITAIIVVIIVYGSLYPLEFRIPVHGAGPIAAFLASIGQLPGRGDTIANVLLYTPFGFFVLASLPLRRARAFGLTTAAGALLSLCLELTQYYVPGRVISFDDVVSNTSGSFLGALAAAAAGENADLPVVAELFGHPVPTFLVLSWLGYRLYPYVPTINLHKYWNALKPIVLTPSLTGYDLFRQTTIWLALYALIEAILGRRRSAWLAPVMVAGALGAEVLIIGTTLQVAETAGAGLALLVWLPLLLAPLRLRSLITGLALFACVIALRLEPFTLLPEAHTFGWVPFLSLMHGSLQVNTLAFLEKLFLYGSMIFLMRSALGGLLAPTLLAAGVLFATSWAERWLPARSAEITDTLVALILGAVFALLPGEQKGESAPGTVRERRNSGWQCAPARAPGVEPERSP
jgi:VanZ family protein